MLHVGAFKVCCRAHMTRNLVSWKENLQNVNVFYFNGIVFYYLCNFFDFELP